MATLEQIGTALKRAAAAGDTAAATKLAAAYKAMQPQPPSPQYRATWAPPIGQTTPGNLDINARKVFSGPNGDYRTENSISIGTDQGEVLIPTVVGGKQLSEADAIKHYQQSGENLGTFASPKDADRYAQTLHERQAKRYAPPPTPGLQQRLAGQQPSANIEDQTPAQQPPSLGQRLMDSTAATANGLVNGIPVLGPLAQNTTDMIGGGLAQLTGGNYGDYVHRQQRLREGYAQRAPAASIAGNIGGALASFGGLGALPGGAEALGITGAKMVPRMVNGLLSTQAIGTADNMARGQKPMDATVNAVLPAFAGGVGGPLIGGAVKGIGGSIAKEMTGWAQNEAVQKALAKGASSAAELRNAGSQLFERAFGPKVPMVSDTAMMKFVGSVQAAVTRYRPNEHTSKEAVGLLQHVMELADAANTPGTVVDLKDLHILRQTANGIRQAAGSSDTSKAIAGKVINELDSFIKTLKPSDILGGADPRQAANDMMKAISVWSRASKVGAIEDAIRAADTYKSGTENGLKLSFLNLMKQPEFARMTKVEQDAIRLVAKGTTKQNIAEGLGKLGFSLGGSASHNILGGTAGTGLVTAALTPFVGPLAAFPAALGITSATGAIGRRMAENIGRSGAERAAQIAATPGIRNVPQMPNRLAPFARPLEIMFRGGAAGWPK